MNKLLGFLVLISANIFAQNGEEVYQFLNLPTSARQASLGGTMNAAWNDDPNVVLANPAIMNEKMQNQLGMNYASYLAEIQYGTLSYVHQLNDEKSYLSVGARYVDYGKFLLTDEIGNNNGEFMAKDIALSLGFAYNISDFLTAGTSFSYVNSQIETYNSSAIVADLGLVFHDIDYNYNIAFVIKNVGYQIKPYDKENEKLPLQINLGFNTRPQFVPVELSFTLSNLQNWNITNPTAKNGQKSSFGKELIDHLAVGAEFFPEKGFNLRLGYNFKRGSELAVEDLRAFSGLSFGFGIRVSYFRFDYSHARYHTSGNVNTFGLRVNLDELLSKRYSWE